MGDYYSDSLNASSLMRVYDTALPRVRQYLQEEIDFVKSRIKASDRVLELGCGYGRIMKELAATGASLVGVDLSSQSIALAGDYLRECPRCEAIRMDAMDLEFFCEFDVVLCLQNGISAISGGAGALISQGMKTLVPGGKAYFSTYSVNFWDHRLSWFREQAEKGLIGAIDEERTKEGQIACVDGFTATTYYREDLRRLGEETGCPYELVEVDESSLFLILTRERG